MLCIEYMFVTKIIILWSFCQYFFNFLAAYLCCRVYLFYNVGLLQELLGTVCPYCQRPFRNRSTLRQRLPTFFIYSKLEHKLM
jgi:hypothetical protein